MINDPVITIWPEGRSIGTSRRELLLRGIPYLLGAHPDRAVVAVGVSPARNRAVLCACYPLPMQQEQPPWGSAAGIADHLLGVLRANSISRVITVAREVPAAPVTAAALSVGLQDRLRAGGITVIDQLDDWPDPERPGRRCRPLTGTRMRPGEGTWYDNSSRGYVVGLGPIQPSPTIAWNGADTWTLRPPEDPAPAAWTDAAARAAVRFDDCVAALAGSLSAGSADAVDRELSARALTSLSDVCQQPCSSADERAWLAELVTRSPAARDAVVQFIAGQDEATRARQWTLPRDRIHVLTWITRYARPGCTAAPASLLAYAAWQERNGTLAAVASARALADDPDCELARQVLDGITNGRAHPSQQNPEPLAPGRVGTQEITSPERASRGPADAGPGESPTGPEDPPVADGPPGNDSQQPLWNTAVRVVANVRAADGPGAVRTLSRALDHAGFEVIADDPLTPDGDPVTTGAVRSEPGTAETPLPGDRSDQGRHPAVRPPRAGTDRARRGL